MTKVLAIGTVLAAIAAPAAAGSIAGQVLYDDLAPPLERISMEEDAACQALQDRPVRVQRLLIGEGGEIANTFIRVMNVPRGEYVAPREAVVVDRQRCLFAPRVVGVMVGQPLEFHNTDDVPHTVRGLARDNEQFSAELALGAAASQHFFETGEAPFRVRCDLHPWELAWVGVLPHPYFTVTGADGTYEIHDIPPGRYWVEAWHEQLGERRGEVEVANDTVILDFFFDFKLPPR